MVDNTNHPRLIDFGVSRITDVHGFTTSGNGTSWAWAAPELLKDGARKTRQSDIYALASTFVEVGSLACSDLFLSPTNPDGQMMTGRPPLTGKHPIISLDQGETPKRPSAGCRFYPGEKLWSYLMFCWEKAETRPTAVEVEQFLDGLHDITDEF